MNILSVRSLAIPAVKVVRFGRFADQRGYFTESFRRADLDRHPEIDFFRGVEFTQTNESYSHPGTLRGLHFQWQPYVGKFLRTVHGHMVDIVLDIRQGSPHFGQALLHDMPADPAPDCGEWIWVPPGFAHGTLITRETRIEYCCTGYYHPATEGCVSPLAPDIDWSLADPELKRLFDRHVAAPLLMSPKDRFGLSVGAWRDDARSAEFVYGRV